MDNNELTAYIVHRLTEEADPGDIIMDVCQETGRPWAEVEEFVKLVQEKNELKITEKQFPLLSSVALATFAAGLVLTGYGIYAIVVSVTAIKVDFGPHDITSYILPIIEKGVDSVSALKPAIFPYFNLILGLMFSPISALISGVAMIFGSLLGMRDVWYKLLYRD